MTNPHPQEIRRTREQAGLSVQQMADLIGVTRMSVYNWEGGVHPMKPRDYDYLLLKIRDAQST